jgi:hypothetical protein
LTKLLKGTLKISEFEFKKKKTINDWIFENQAHLYSEEGEAINEQFFKEDGKLWKIWLSEYFQ